jgi:hypothetical protein
MMRLVSRLFVASLSVLLSSSLAAKAADNIKIASTGPGGGVSDSAVKVLVDQSLLEFKSKDAVALDKVRDWSFAERARQELEGSIKESNAAK